MRLVLLDDGRTEVTFRQSWLNTFFDCPELARREAFEGLRSTDTDATAMGTALHAGAEHHLRTGDDYESCLQVAAAAFLALADQVRWVQVATKDTALKYIGVCLAAWWADVRPKLGAPVAIEHNFNVPLLETDQYVIRLSGTMDYVDDLGIIWDWKTANDADKYGRKAWEHRRWSIQPTVYTYAWHHETGEYAPFTFAATLKGSQRKPAQFVTVVRNETHWDYLTTQLMPIIEMAEANLSQWPMRDQHVLCSPKWCPAWDTCKGKAVVLP